MIPRFTVAAASVALLLGAAAPMAMAADAPAYIAAAVSDASRPESDTKRDADRKPAEMLAFAHVKPGQKVADFIPGGGYFTRLFAKAVGPKGKVYAIVPEEFIKLPKRNPTDPERDTAIRGLATEPGYTNIKVVNPPIKGFKLPEKVDVIWTSQNYHDLHNKAFGSPDMMAFNKAVYAALKPSGVFIVLDHTAAAGSGISATDTLHRIDVEAVKKEVTAAGFKLDGSSDALKNGADDHTKGVFDASLRGKTDQFVLRFKK